MGQGGDRPAAMNRREALRRMAYVAPALWVLDVGVARRALAWSGVQSCADDEEYPGQGWGYGHHCGPGNGLGHEDGGPDDEHRQDGGQRQDDEHRQDGEGR